MSKAPGSLNIKSQAFEADAEIERNLVVKSSRVTRVVQLLTALQAAKSHSAGELAKMFTKSRRTIFRDLKELAAIGVPCRYDSRTAGYRIDPGFFLPPIDLNLQEALSLLLLVHKASGQIQLPYRNSALLAALKIENNLPVKIKQYCGTALRSISARAAAQAQAQSFGGLDRTFSELHKAIIQKQKVQTLYHSLFEGKDIELQLSPCHLLYNQRAWYVLGYSSLHRSIRTFKLNRIKELTVLDAPAAVPAERFDPAEYLGRAWSMIPEGRLYNVQLRFLPKVAQNVAEVHWHSTQKVHHNEDGSATVEFRVDGLGEITWWILGYGDQVQILAPKILRDKVVSVAKNIVALNKQS